MSLKRRQTSRVAIQRLLNFAESDRLQQATLIDLNERLRQLGERVGSFHEEHQKVVDDTLDDAMDVQHDFYNQVTEERQQIAVLIHTKIAEIHKAAHHQREAAHAEQVRQENEQIRLNED